MRQQRKKGTDFAGFGVKVLALGLECLRSPPQKVDKDPEGTGPAGNHTGIQTSQSFVQRCKDDNIRSLASNRCVLQAFCLLLEGSCMKQTCCKSPQM